MSHIRLPVLVTEGEWSMSEHKEAQAFAEFTDIIETLRGEHGCPWDKEQTFESLKPCLINEMTEALAGIDLYTQTGDAENLCEELGDVLMQVVLLSQIAKEKGLFDITDVINGISEKMVRRHPHVFGAPGAELQDWGVIKQQEKQQRSRELEQAEKAAFRAAAGQIICHLSER